MRFCLCGLVKELLGQKGEVIVSKLLDFEFQPGVLHAEVHLVPAICSAIFNMVSNENPGLRRLMHKYDAALMSNAMHVSYQKFNEILADMLTDIIPTIDAVEKWIWVRPMVVAIVGLFDNSVLVFAL